MLKKTIKVGQNLFALLGFAAVLEVFVKCALANDPTFSNFPSTSWVACWLSLAMYHSVLLLVLSKPGLPKHKLSMWLLFGMVLKLWSGDIRMK